MVGGAEWDSFRRTDGRTDGRPVTEANSSIAMVNSETTSQVADVSSVAVCLIHSAS